MMNLMLPVFSAAGNPGWGPVTARLSEVQFFTRARKHTYAGALGGGEGYIEVLLFLRIFPPPEGCAPTHSPVLMASRGGA